MRPTILSRIKMKALTAFKNVWNHWNITKRFMILRSPTEHEKGRLFTHSRSSPGRGEDEEGGPQGIK
jgi:hypothetical protein